MCKVIKNGNCYNKGSVLLVEKPFAYVLKSAYKTDRCDFCLKKGELLKCSVCSETYYCNRGCQKNGWYFHKKECHNLKRVAPKVVPDAARLLARILFKLEKGGANERAFYSDRHFRTFKDLMSHYNEIKEDCRRMEHFTSIHAVLEEYLKDSFLPNATELLIIFGKMVINTFNILDAETQSIGSGIYLGASVIDHSCDFNAVALFDGPDICIRTVVNIEQLDWNKVFISYIELLNTPSERQKMLQESYYFLCQCRRCMDIEELGLMNSTICQNLSCKAKINIISNKKDEVCESCRKSVSPETFEEIDEIQQFTEQQLKDMHHIASDLDVCRICLRKQEGLFHSMHILRTKVLDLAMDSCIALGQWTDALTYGEKLIDPFQRYYGRMHPVTGIFFMKMGKIALLVDHINEARQWLQAAMEILIITHGPKHPILTEELCSYLQQCNELN